MAFAIKAGITDPEAPGFTFTAQKTMYGGKHVAVGALIFVFASEKQGGHGLIARGIVAAAEPVARQPGLARQTPRVSLDIRCNGRAQRRLGRAELRHLTQWDDGQPGTELNFKFYRQATDKLVSITARTAAWLDTFF